MEYIKSVIAQDYTPAADGVVTFDLPVNPLSHIIFTIKALNVTDEASLANLLALVTKIEVLYQGAAIFSMSAADLYALDVILFGQSPLLANQVATDKATRWVSLIIPFGRLTLNPKEAFPATTKGQLQLQATVDIATAEADGLILQIETIEMPEATPDRFLKVHTLSKTPSATGDLDVDLPIGNLLASIMLFSTTVPTGTAWTTTVDQVKLLVNNREYHISKANWESIHGELLLRSGHKQSYDGSADDDDIKQYGLLDFSPRAVDDFLLDTAGKASVKLRITAGDTNVLRIFPMELLEAARAGRGTPAA